MVRIIVSAIFVAAYLAALVCYFFSETSGDHPRRVCNKMIMATMFLCYGFVEYFRLESAPLSVHLVGLAALVFAWLGDMYLLFSFTKGGILFMISNFIYTGYMLYVAVSSGVRIYKFWWCLLIFLALNAWVWYLQKSGKIDFSKVKAFKLYMATTTMMGCTGIGLAALLPNTRWILLGVGIALFMISDYFLMFHNFKNKESKAILRLNSGTYFIGMLLVALSYSFIG